MNFGRLYTVDFKTLVDVLAVSANEYLHQLGMPMRDGPAPQSPHRNSDGSEAVKHRLKSAVVRLITDTPRGVVVWLDLEYTELFEINEATVPGPERSAPES